MPIFEERMIYKVGRSSLAITLPRNWLKYFGLGAGDIVEITGNGDLIIRPRKKAESTAPVKTPSQIHNSPKTMEDRLFLEEQRP